MRFSRISIVTDKSSWLNSYIDTLVAKLKEYAAEVVLIHDLILLQPSDIVFYLSFSKIVPKKILNQHRHNLVVHGSALPLGKGWSPLTWQILEGRNDIPMTLFEADEALDSGKIYLQEIIQFAGHELIEEMRIVQADFTIRLCFQFVAYYDVVVRTARIQSGESSFYKKRLSSDSELDKDKTLQELFNLLRVVDNEKYPAYFEYLGCKYVIKIEKQKV
ncbi:MAG: methionyl-tRNA formyltransferase-like protein [uncultured bacterium]|nr:MAG: methionyl-tRNA formyltransferase-like protein [uncultured bacterium]OGT25461.1 MAG: methionyl-tRNA formyltransferase [Gammaproteobacteria bacterium RIFCSPHIGHO2_02_FULL_42_43]OGT27528.1 MAG: methionyl-tRNA formyltransferase [Gammaproteobacteria bacterium RIFCSPHIGHO2_01_FULL_42_8]OGT51412.1 MAG: methionyl-tRNA formyltransferase [Gammaproteobacteria bacterium RIFCSPHIGHO2_12_FULL_41_25]OGT62114.1 MAG: methionyl-tRNA formyltransferase [Gammaproteobacteria bacterium RIFCSPLOWO2_02_FULL_42_